jgi:gliding motility-associated-like protein
MGVRSLIKWLLCGISFFIASFLEAQPQMCPVNSNFSTGTLTHWYAYTGHFAGQGGSLATQTYDSTIAAPTGTVGAAFIPEYNFPAMNGVTVNTTPGVDQFGGFPTIPIINGYQYNYSVQVGSTAITSSAGGLYRGISYIINVPPGLPSKPYTMTYAYAMVLENGNHAPNQQPQFTATLNTSSGKIACADAFYFLPTVPGPGATGNVLDVAAATQQGFSLSSVPSPNNNGNAGETRNRVWTKGWTEVTFDLAPYRGQQVSLTFEADNCMPRGHFAYAYIALRNTCDGLNISGPLVACTNSTLNYSVPALANASYQWTVPADSNITSSGNSNIISVLPGNQIGFITVNEQNSCANLFDTIQVSTSPPTVAGSVNSNNAVCTHNNTTTLTLGGYTGNILSWLSSTNGSSWNTITNTTSTYTAINLDSTTQYKALVQNGIACSIDSSATAIITVSPLSVGGSLSPTNISICQGQNNGLPNISLSGNTGSVFNWQFSTDSIHWNNVNPIKKDSSYNINGLNKPTQLRAIINSGTCPADTSSVAYIQMYNALFPQASIFPADTSVCFGTASKLQANISIGTNYTWSNPNLIFNGGNGTIGAAPYVINAQVAPAKTTKYILSIQNAGCPNLLIDTFNVNVLPKVVVNAGHDTAVVANQPLQLNAISNTDSLTTTFNWTPSTGLSNPFIHNPISLLDASIDSIIYRVIATDSIGCFDTAHIKVVVYKTLPEIFVPSGFTPNNDGRNDILKPITVGIAQFQYFRIYNRLGQLIYATSQIGTGWDGNFGGSPQPSGTYVYMTQGVDYSGKIVFRKGTVVLIR